MEKKKHMDAAYAFSQFVAETQFEDLPREVVDVAKKSLLDTLGLGLGASTAEGIKGLYEMISGWGGREESTVFGFGGKFPSVNAAMINSAMCHALEFDDTYWEAGLHPSCVAVPSAFAISEFVGSVDGKKFIAALSVATEMGCRIGKATKFRKNKGQIMAGWDDTAICGSFMAASMGKLLGFDKEMIHNALGIAYTQAAGNAQGIREGVLTKRINPAFAARGGLTAAFMAQKGITGAKNIFEDGIASYYRVYHAGYNQKTLTEGLGKEFLMLGIDIKSYPCCLMSAAACEAAQKLSKEHHIKPEEVKEITARVYPHAVTVCFPEETRQKPRSPEDAQFSLPWLVSCAMVRGNATLNEFTKESIKDPDLLKMAAKVKGIIDPSFTSMEQTVMKIKTKRGAFKTTVFHPHGTTGNPMSLEDVAKKFWDCSSRSVKPIPDGNKRTVIDMVKDLEKVKDVAEIMRLLT